MKKSKIVIFGFSLFEMLIVITIFAVLGVLTSRIVLLSLRGVSKSSSLLSVRENLDFALSVIDRNIRNANSIVSCTDKQITYTDENGQTSTFSCREIGTSSGNIASASAQLTSKDVNVTDCTITCNLDSSGNPPSVSIDLTGVDVSHSGIESSKVTISSKIYLRTY